MNRRERRSTEKMLGLTKHYKTLSLKAKWELQADRIKLGKERQEETKEKIRQQVQEQDEILESKRIYTIAESIAKAKKIPVTEAMDEAKAEFQSYKK